MILARQYDEALAHWRKVQSADPDNRQAGRMIAALIIDSSRQQAGLSPSASLDLALPGVAAAPSARMDAADAAVADSLAGTITGIRLTRIQQLEKAIKDELANADVYLELARLYLDKGREYEAERLLARARDDTGRDPRVLALAEDVTMLRLAKKVAAAERDVELENARESQAALEQMLKERDRLEIEIYRERARRDPDDLGVRCELGRRLARAGKHDEARTYLDQAMQHESSRCHAAVALGDLLLAAGQPSEATRHYRMAAAAAGQTGQAECQSQALLKAAEVASRCQLVRLARRYVAELLRAVPGHPAGTAMLEALERKVV